MMRSPSQWPGTARSSASAGRSEIITMFGIFPLPRCLPLRATLCTPGPQAAVQLSSQLTPALDEQRLVDRLVAHPHRRIVRVLEAQPPGDLLGRPCLVEPELDLIAQRGAHDELGDLRPAGAARGPCVRLDGLVRGETSVRLHLLETVETARPMRHAMEANVSPWAIPTLISSRSTSESRAADDAGAVLASGASGARPARWSSSCDSWPPRSDVARVLPYAGAVSRSALPATASRPRQLPPLGPSQDGRDVAPLQ